MNDNKAWNMFVFRAGTETVSGSSLVQALAAELRFLRAGSPDALLNVLLRSGELECAFADVDSPETPRFSAVTDALARRLVSPASGFSNAELLSRLPISVPKSVKISPPEGFAYYALHPLEVADLAGSIPVRSGVTAVVGIRSIGTTLSALVVAALLRTNRKAERITVRPNGHPYDRRTQFSTEQLRWIAKQRANSAEFFVVDEGPGISGSSFLSVGEALLEAGVAREQIKFLCSRQPDISTLKARNASVRWPGFRSYHVAPDSHVPPDAKVYIGAGVWRDHVFADPSQWPASWTSMERLKFLSLDRRMIFKFEGFGRFGLEVHDRAELMAEAGFSPRPHEYADGFGCYPMIQGQPLWPEDLGHEVLERMAEYCAFRSAAFRSGKMRSSEELEKMLRFNVSQEFGTELQLSPGALSSSNPIIADGRMLPHEWLRDQSGQLLKLDGTTHGDDHFFPGPTDIAWDLAGAIVECRMNREAMEYFLKRYCHASGDDPQERLPAFLLAYAVFRMAYCKMAAAALCGSREEERLQRAYTGYRDYVSTISNRCEQGIAAD